MIRHLQEWQELQNNSQPEQLQMQQQFQQQCNKPNDASLKCKHNSCIKVLIMSFINGAFSGAKYRFVYSLVMTIFFNRNDSILKSVKAILQQSYQHGIYVGKLFFLFRLFSCFLRQFSNYLINLPIFSKTNKKFMHPKKQVKYVQKFKQIIVFTSGFMAGHIAFSDSDNIGTQILMYVGSRVIHSLGIELQRKHLLSNDIKYFPILSAIGWGVTMYQFAEDNTVISKHLRDALKYILKDRADQWDLLFFPKNQQMY